MAHPKRRTSKSRRNKRRSHHRIKDTQLTECSNCGALHRFHHVCMECGHYRGRQVLEVKS
ncbi:MAG: 50S ribosomal protein L32 [Bacteroidota bacterium]